MSFVLELQFDLPSEKFVGSLMQQLENMGLPSNLLERSVLPHLTLLIDETLPGQAVLGKLDEVFEKQDTFQLKAISLGTFANKHGVLFLGVVCKSYVAALNPPYTLTSKPSAIFEKLSKNLVH